MRPDWTDTALSIVIVAALAFYVLGTCGADAVTRLRVAAGCGTGVEQRADGGR